MPVFKEISFHLIALWPFYGIEAHWIILQLQKIYSALWKTDR